MVRRFFKKRILAGCLVVMLLSVLMSSTTITVVADVGVYYSYTLENGKATITEFHPLSFAGDLTIPATIDGYPVTAIGSEAFLACTSLKSVTIPSGVESIGDSAFYGCKSLTSITIPHSVTTIGSLSFSECSSLKSVSLPKDIKVIDYFTFRYCTSLKSVTIPYGVTEIRNFAFSNCTSLESVTIPDSVTILCESSFSNCTSLKRIVIPKSVRSMKQWSFFNCTSLADVWYIGESREDVGVHSSNYAVFDATWHCVSRCPNDLHYAMGCDEVCAACHTKLEGINEHFYDNACDTECAECETTRSVGEHVYVDGEDLDCNHCGFVRTIDTSPTTSPTNMVFTNRYTMLGVIAFFVLIVVVCIAIHVKNRKVLATKNADAMPPYPLDTAATNEFCGNCGNLFTSSDPFCSKCGCSRHENNV